MAELLDDLIGQLDSDKISQLGTELGVDSDSIQKAVGAALPALIGAFSNASSDSQSLDRLTQAVEHQDHGILDNLASVLKGVLGGSTLGTEGSDALSEVLGGRQQQVENAVSKTSGISSETVGKLIKMLGPMVVATIAKQMTDKKVTADSVNDHLKREQSSIDDAHPGLLGKLFDQDNDGDFDLSDIADVVMSQINSK